MNEYMRVIAEKSRGSNPPAPDDIIGADGLRVCAKCGEPKEIIMDGQKVSVACKCRISERERAEREKRDAQREERRKNCFSSPILAEAKLDSAEQTKAVDIARKYVLHWEEMREGIGRAHV